MEIGSTITASEYFIVFSSPISGEIVDITENICIIKCPDESLVSVKQEKIKSINCISQEIVEYYTTEKTFLLEFAAITYCGRIFNIQENPKLYEEHIFGYKKISQETLHKLYTNFTVNPIPCNSDESGMPKYEYLSVNLLGGIFSSNGLVVKILEIFMNEHNKSPKSFNKSRIIYTISKLKICLEYREQSGSTLDPIHQEASKNAIKALSNCCERAQYILNKCI